MKDGRLQNVVDNNVFLKLVLENIASAWKVNFQTESAISMICKISVIIILRGSCRK